MKKNIIFAVAASVLFSSALFASVPAAEEMFTCGEEPEPGIAIKSEHRCSAAEKEVQNEAATTTEAPSEPERWSYRITNTGNVKLTNVRVIDDRFVNIHCQKTDLEVGQSMTCVAHDLISDIDLHAGQGCAAGDHVQIKDSGVQVTTKGDCDSGT
jgi:hypothetical protein